MSAKRRERKVGFLHTTPATIEMVKRFVQAAFPGVVPVPVYDCNVKIDNFHSPVGVTPRVNLLRWADCAARLESSGCEAIGSC